MEASNASVVLHEEEFDEQILNEMVEMDGEYNLENNGFEICVDSDPVEQQQTVSGLDDGCQKDGARKRKRRSNLTEFGEDVTTKRKNESAKRELTSIVNQLGKIEKQLNRKDDEPCVTINFVATFKSFKSNRVNTFKYPLDAEVKQTLMDYDTTITAVKNAVKEAVCDLAKDLPNKECVTDVIASSSVSHELMTPTKTIAAFTSLPSPVSVKGQPVSSKNLCAKNSCTFGKRLRKHVWIKCSHRSDEGQGCAYWVHATCIGFPTLKEENASMLDGWCCPEHTDILMKKK